MLIVHSRAASIAVSREYGVDSSKLRIVPHGHYRDAYPPPISRYEARRQLDLPQDALVFLYFGYLRPYKGLEDLIKAWHDRAVKTNGERLVIAGAPIDEDYGASLRASVSALRDALLLDQRIPDGLVATLFSAADVVLAPFRQSLTSGSIVLALTYGKPVLAPRLDSIEELVEHRGGMLYEVGDEDGLKHTLERCILQRDVVHQLQTETSVTGMEWSVLAVDILDAYKVTVE